MAQTFSQRLSGLVFALVLTFPVVTSGEEAFRATTKHADDTVELHTAKNRVLFSVESPTGISSATIKRITKEWPRQVVLRLHLKGLERLTISNGDTTLNLSVSSHREDPLVQLWLNNEEDAALNTTSRFWMRVHRVDTEKLSPNENPTKSRRYYEMQLPQALLAGSANTLTAKWIDFYR